MSKAGSEGGDLKKLESSIKQVATNHFIDNPTLNSLLVSGWKQAVDTALNDGILTEDEEAALSELKQHFSLSQDELGEEGSFLKVIKSATLRDILEGKVPERVSFDGNIPFNLQKTEKIAWIFQNVDYYEEKTKTHYVGGSQGVSIRIAKGLYYRTGAFKGERVQTSETTHIDTGLLAATNKHIYFSGSSKRFRINYDKIVAFEPYSDGIGVQRDAQTAKPQSLTTGDDWFTYNLITHLARI